MDLKHVIIAEGLNGMDPEQLVEVAADAASIHQMVMDEFAAREERNARARAAAEALKPGADTTKKRGPKPRAAAADAVTSDAVPPGSGLLRTL